MLSPGQYHKLIPRDYLENLKLRKMLLLASLDLKVRRGLIEMCRQDILFFINFAVIQINPADVEREVGPFITWDFQEAAVKETIRVLMEVRDEMIWEKSREMGATWLALIIALWLCLFHSHKRVIVISHSEQAVDKSGNEGSLFSKIRFMIDYLPKWMSEGISGQRLGLKFSKTRSSITGFASTARSGVGDRAAFIILDEFSKQVAAREILGQTKDTGPCLIIGTHYGVGTCYFDLTQDEDRHKLIFHWSMHPEKKKGLYKYNPLTSRVEPLDPTYEYPPDFDFVMDGKPDGGPFPGLRSPWYDRYCRRAVNDRDVAMHQDIDPKGSSEQYFDRIKIGQLKRNLCVSPWLTGDIDYNHDTGSFHRFVGSGAGPLRLWCNLDLEGNPPPSRYGAGCDLSAGLGKTNTCLSIIDANTGEKVAEYITSSVAPDAFAYIAVALCRWFKAPYGEGAKLAWESNGPFGRSFWVRFSKFNYGNIHYDESRNVARGATRASFGELIPGWYKGTDSGPALLAAYQSALQAGEITNRSEYALDECLGYVYLKDGTVDHSRRKSAADNSAAKDNHGDIVIADALAWKMCLSMGLGHAKMAEVVPPPSIYTLAGRRELWEKNRRRELAYD